MIDENAAKRSAVRYRTEESTPDRHRHKERMMELTYLQDPGHGWVGCPLPLARQFGILPKVSRYSFVEADRDILWLEEDCDAGLLMRALADSSIAYTIKERHAPVSAYVRGLPRWEGGAA